MVVQAFILENIDLPAIKDSCDTLNLYVPHPLQRGTCFAFMPPNPNT